MKTPSLCGLVGALATTIAVADTRSSASYSITTDTLDSAGEATTSYAGNVRTVRHLNATESKRFYRVEITVD